MEPAGDQQPTTTELEVWLPPQSFPASGDMLADETQRRGGPRRLVAALRRLPVGRVYQTVGQAARDLRSRAWVRFSAPPDGIGPSRA